MEGGHNPDKSQVAGWYPGGLTKEPEPKPIRTGVTLHSMCVIKGYMLHVRTYGGKNDKDIKKNSWGSLSIYKYLTLDSVYTGELLAQVVDKAWKMNVIVTTQWNR